MIIKDGFEEYLEEDENVDFSSEIIKDFTKKLFRDCTNDIEKIRTAFEFVRDEISHSWDIQSTKVTRTASEVLTYKEGICYAKSNLLAGLLRSQGIPTGFCYQRLTLGDTPETGYCIHALNGVYIAEMKKWIRIDARGNKKGVNAQFDVNREQLAFVVRTEYGERDDEIIYSKPLNITMDTLRNNDNCIEMVKYWLPKDF